MSSTVGIPLSLLKDLKEEPSNATTKSSKTVPRHTKAGYADSPISTGKISTSPKLKTVAFSETGESPKQSQPQSPTKDGTLDVIHSILQKQRPKTNTSPAYSNPSSPQTAAVLKEKYSHLMSANDESNPFTAFLYSNLEPRGSPTAPNPLSSKNINLTSNFMPDDFQLVAALEAKSSNVENEGQTFPSLRPSSRKEVLLLKNAMDTMLSRIGASSQEDYPTEMHALLTVIQEEQKVYDMIFREIIRQVTIQMHERGQILADIRERYVHMFHKVPKQVRSLHTELLAQRKLNRRLSEELIKSKDSMEKLMSEFESVKKHDADVTKMAQQAQQKLVNVLTQSDNTDEILEEYHRLYRMQRDRIEEQKQSLESEKKMWMDLAFNLALRIGIEHGLSEITDLHRFEHTRLRASNHIILHINNRNESELQDLEKKIGTWRARMLKLSVMVTEEDKHNMNGLQTLHKHIKDVITAIKNKETVGDEVETDFQPIKSFQLRDVRDVGEALLSWTHQITEVANRFTSDKDLGYREEIKHIRVSAEQWMDFSHKIFQRMEKTSKAKEYEVHRKVISTIRDEVEDWLNRLDMRVAGEDGTASVVISLQNQLEDKYSAYSLRDYDKPLMSSEKASLAEAFDAWIDQISSVMNILSDSFEKEQTKIPVLVENWVTRILDQMNNDTDIRTQESSRLHTSLISWLVQLLVKGAKPVEAEGDLQQLHQEIRAYQSVLLKDAEELELISDEQTDLRKVLLNSSENWMLMSKRLMKSELRVGRQKSFQAEALDNISKDEDEEKKENAESTEAKSPEESPKPEPNTDQESLPPSITLNE